MYDFKISASDTATMYRDLASALEGLTAGETDAVANMANAAALMWETLPDLNWAGFYRNLGGELVVGPFQGRPACIRIAFGSGVCGVAAETLQVQRVADVNAFASHIACDSASASELVVPIIRNGLVEDISRSAPTVADLMDLSDPASVTGKHLFGIEELATASSPIGEQRAKIREFIQPALLCCAENFGEADQLFFPSLRKLRSSFARPPEQGLENFRRAK